MKTLNKKSLASWAAASLMVALSWVAFGANIVGTPGNDDGITFPILLGTAANDNLNGRGGSDVIVDVFGGNDQFNTHSTLVAGEAPGVFDFVLDTGGNNRIFGGPEIFDFFIVTGGNNKIATGGGVFDLALTGTGNDEVASTSALGVASIADFFIDFGGGSNVFNGNGGGVDILIGGPGNDTLTGSAALLNVLLANVLPLTGTDRNILESATTSAFGIPGIGILVDSAGPDKLKGGNQATDFVLGVFGAPVGTTNQLLGGDENFNVLPFPGDLIIGGVGADVYLPGKGFDINLDPFGGNDTFVLRPGDTIAGTFELVLCGGPPGTDLDVVQLKGFNVRTAVITPVISSGLPGTIPGDIFTLVSDPNSGAFSGYALIFCERRTFPR